MNLELLRRKRVKRLGVKTSSHTGQRRIFFILDRATRKFPGDVGLWMQYLTFARKQRSNKKVSQILTSMLRLHPAKAEMWVYAAGYAMDERGDMTEARGYMQRGLRFCKEDKLWVEYARLELMWVAKIWARRRILGIDDEQQESNLHKLDDAEGLGGDMVALPKVTEEDINPNKRPGVDLDQTTLDKLGASPALSGAIPMVIFDAAMKQFKHDEKLCLQFFDMVSEFHDLPCVKKILDYILEALQASQSPEAVIRFIQQPVIGLKATSAGFPTMFGLSLNRMKTTFKRLKPLPTGGTLEGYIIDWVLPYLREKELDPDVRKVIEMTVRKVWSQLQAAVTTRPDGRAAEVSRLVGNLQSQGLQDITEPATAWAIRTWPNDAKLFSQAGQLHNQ